jgi:hypothetical protein
VEDGHGRREYADEQHDDVAESPVGERERAVEEDCEDDQRSV